MNIVLLCIKIFFVRILDVSLGTFRTIVLVKGKTLYAGLIGFFEVLIWFLVVKEALNTDYNGIWIAIAYSAGFATGTIIGGTLSSKFIKGSLTVQIISNVANILVPKLRDEGYAVSVIDIKGKDEENAKNMLFVEINGKNLPHLRSLIKSTDSNAFVVVNETKFVQNGLIK